MRPVDGIFGKFNQFFAVKYIFENYNLAIFLPIYLRILLIKYLRHFYLTNYLKEACKDITKNG